MDIFLKYTTYSVSDFVNLHNISFLDSSKSTRGTFEQSLKRIEKIYEKPLEQLNADYLRDSVALMKKLEDSKYSSNTILTTYTQILKVLKMIDAPLNIYSKYVKLLKEKTKDRDEIQQLKIEIQKETLIPYKQLQTELEANRDEIMEGEDNFGELRNYILISLFVNQIPVRVSNYTKMKMTKKSSEYTDDNYNWLYIKGDTMMFVFNKYRTVNRIGTKELIIQDSKLKSILSYYIDSYNITEGQYLFPKEIYSSKRRPMIAKDMNSAIMLATYQIYGQALSVEQIRASYLQYIAEIDPDFESKMEIASIMGYSNTLKMEAYE